jgi:uncharacterized protein (DUF4415 family)
MKKKKIDLSGYSDGPVDDPDSPELTADIIRRMRPMREVHPEFVKAIEEMRKRGRPPLEHPKVQVTLRLDDSVVKAFREDGPGWQGRINEELKKTVKRRRERKK